ncbi:MAG: succinylglutamate desuccinylase/aspartoacylase family protein [Thermoplasmatota archaeon]
MTPPAKRPAAKKQKPPVDPLKERLAEAAARDWSKKQRIAGRLVAAGQVREMNLKVGETVTHQPASIPITVVRGVRPGPTLVVTAAVHGDEINGTAVVRAVLDKLEPEALAGTFVGVPVVNRFGFPTGDRYLPDRRDLNRFFPGAPDGSMANRVAHVVFEKVVRAADVVLDLHTAAGGRANLCHVRGDADRPEVKELMRAFGVPVMLDGAGPEGSLRRAALDAGIPSIIFEAGEPNRFQHHVVAIGARGVLRTMAKLGMIKRRLTKPALQVLVRKSEWVRTDHGGLLDLDVEPGDLVRTKQRIGIVHDPFGRHVDVITAPRSGVVLSVATVPLTHPGNAVVHIGHLHKTLQKARDYVKAGGDLGHVNWKPPRQRGSQSSASKATT